LTLPEGCNLYSYCHNNPISYVDPTGHSPKWWQWLLFGVGAALVVGAITVLTMGVGTTVMATTMAGAAMHGAAVGTLIGAGIGAGLGAIIGGATSDWSVEGILGGAMSGFGIGAFVGAIQYTNAANSWYGGKDKMISHFLDHGQKEGYKNVIQYTKSAKNIIKNGTYVSQKNAYLLSKTANQFYYVGVAKNSSLITTYFTKTLTKTAMALLGLI
jgi:YD repeat protein